MIKHPYLKRRLNTEYSQRWIVERSHENFYENYQLSIDQFLLSLVDRNKAPKSRTVGQERKTDNKQLMIKQMDDRMDQPTDQPRKFWSRVFAAKNDRRQKDCQ